MCVSCFSTAEAMVLGSAGAAASAGGAWRHVVDVVRGRSALDRQAMTYAHHAEFLRSMGLDVEEVLGPRPQGEVARV